MLGLMVAALTVALTAAAKFRRRPARPIPPALRRGRPCRGGRPTRARRRNRRAVDHPDAARRNDRLMVAEWTARPRPPCPRPVEHVANTSAGSAVPCSVSLTLTYGSDWREAKRAIERILNRLFDADTSTQAVRRLSTSTVLCCRPTGCCLPSPSILQTQGRPDRAGLRTDGRTPGASLSAGHGRLSWIEGEPAVDLAYPTIALSDASAPLPSRLRAS